MLGKDSRFHGSYTGSVYRTQDNKQCDTQQNRNTHDMETVNKRVCMAAETNCLKLNWSRDEQISERRVTATEIGVISWCFLHDEVVSN